MLDVGNHVQEDLIGLHKDFNGRTGFVCGYQTGPQTLEEFLQVVQERSTRTTLTQHICEVIEAIKLGGGREETADD